MRSEIFNYIKIVNYIHMESISEIKKSKDLIKKLKSGSQVILLRHAESKQNEASKRLSSIEHTEEDILRHKTNFLSRDWSITELGKKQCESTAEITNKLKVEIVLVSPLKRTLQTAYHVFRSHPNFENI